MHDLHGRHSRCRFTRPLTLHTLTCAYLHIRRYRLFKMLHLLPLDAMELPNFTVINFALRILGASRIIQICLPTCILCAAGLTRRDLISSLPHARAHTRTHSHTRTSLLDFRPFGAPLTY